MKMKMIEEFCHKHNACKGGREWALENCQTMNEVWEKAKPEWLIWVATRNGVLTEKERRLFAVWCARQVQHLMTDKRSIAALDVEERYANGSATVDELKAARDAAWEAARAADITEAEARAARAAARAAEDWDADWAAREAARAARAAAEADSDADSEAAWEAAWGAQAQYIRTNCKPNFER